MRETTEKWELLGNDDAICLTTPGQVVQLCSSDPRDQLQGMQACRARAQLARSSRASFRLRRYSRTNVRPSTIKIRVEYYRTDLKKASFSIFNLLLSLSIHLCIFLSFSFLLFATYLLNICRLYSTFCWKSLELGLKFYQIFIDHGIHNKNDHILNLYVHINLLYYYIIL